MTRKRYVQNVRVRLVREPSPVRVESVTIRMPQDAALVLRALYPADLAREQFSVLALNTRNRVLSHEVVSTGSLNGSLVHPREIYLHAVLQNAAAIVCCHNHPSGDVQPSTEDRELTGRLQNAGTILGIDLLDHVILGFGASYYSFKANGFL